METKNYNKIQNCIQPNYWPLFEIKCSANGLGVIEGEYYYKLIIKNYVPLGHIYLYIEEMGTNNQYLLELDYKAHWYRFRHCSKYRNERVVILGNQVDKDLESYHIRQIFKPEYLANKLLSYEDWHVNGYFLLNKLVNAYYNPLKVLCQEVLAKEHAELVK